MHAHHVEHWANGGETSLANLILLCDVHHRLVHEEGFSIEKDYRDRWFFRRPDGRAVPACGYRPEDVTDDGIAAADEYFDGRTSAEGSRLSGTGFHTSAEGSRTSTEESMVREPFPAAYRAPRRPRDRRHLRGGTFDWRARCERNVRRGSLMSP